MLLNAAVVDATGKVIRLRPFPGGRQRPSPIDLGDGSKIYRLGQEQINTVQIGWVTLDEGKTYIP